MRAFSICLSLPGLFITALFSPSILSERTEFSFLSRYYSIVMCAHHFPHSSTYYRRCHFINWLLWIVLHWTWQYRDFSLTYWFQIFQLIPRNGLSGSYRDPTFSVLRGIHGVFHNVCIHLNDHQPCTRVLVSPFSCPNWHQFLYHDRWHERCQMTIYWVPDNWRYWAFLYTSWHLHVFFWQDVYYQLILYFLM